MLKLTKAFALCGATDEAMALAEEVAFLQAVRAPLIKRGGGPGGASTDPDFALRQLLSEALVAEDVTDIFQVAGLSNPDVGIMSDQFLAEVGKMPQKNLAVELLQRLVKDALKTRFKTNLVQQKRFIDILPALKSEDSFSRTSIAARSIQVGRRFAAQCHRSGLTRAPRPFSLSTSPAARVFPR